MHNFQIIKPYEHVIYMFKEVIDLVPPIKGEKLSIRYSLPEDALVLNVRDEQKDTFKSNDLDHCIRVHAWLNMISQIHYTLFNVNSILLLVSILPVTEGIAEISFLTDQSFVESPLSVRIHMLRVFKETLDLLPFRRLQAKVKHNFKVGIDFVEYLGFVKEGVLKEFGPLFDDYYIFGRV